MFRKIKAKNTVKRFSLSVSKHYYCIPARMFLSVQRSVHCSWPFETQELKKHSWNVQKPSRIVGQWWLATQPALLDSGSVRILKKHGLHEPRLCGSGFFSVHPWPVRAGPRPTLVGKVHALHDERPETFAKIQKLIKG
jgi:hypothetical protein